MLSRIFLVSGVAIAVIGVLAAPWISHDWLKASAIPQNEVTVAAAVMVIVIALRWRTEPYRSLLVGFERQVLLNAINGVFHDAAIPGRAWRCSPLSAARSWPSSSSSSWSWCCETAAILIAAHRLLPKDRLPPAPAQSTWATLRPLPGFRCGIAFTAVLWLADIAVRQADSVLDPAAEDLRRLRAGDRVAATGLGLLVSPISGQVLLPRMTALKAKADEVEFRRIYRTGTAVITALVTPAALLLALFAYQVMRVWTGDQAIAAQAAPILRWYAFGSGLQCLVSFTYFLQYAHGDLKLHVWGNSIFAAVLVPAIAVAAYTHGAVGTGVVWFAANLFYVLIWSFIVHGRFAPGLHWPWLGRDVLLVGAPAAVILVAAAPGALASGREPRIAGLGVARDPRRRVGRSVRPVDPRRGQNRPVVRATQSSQRLGGLRLAEEPRQRKGARRTTASGATPYDAAPPPPRRQQPSRTVSPAATLTAPAPFCALAVHIRLNSATGSGAAAYAGSGGADTASRRY